MADNTERTQRWDDIRREQFGSMNALLIALGTGLLVFQASPLIGEIKPVGRAYVVSLISIVVIALSIGAGILCGWNRLKDARLTAQVTRQSTNADELRARARKAGDQSWTLLSWQMGLFMLGAVLVGVRILL